jgi:hypothetical protein
MDPAELLKNRVKLWSNLMKIITILFSLLIFFLNLNIDSQWIQTNGPSAGDVRCLAISGTYVYAGTYENGIFRSSNYGGNWIAVNNGMINSNITSLGVNGTDIYAGTFGSLVFRSTNNGASWFEAGYGLPGQSVYGFASVGSNIYTATDLNGIYRSTNNGANWTEVSNGLTSRMTRALIVCSKVLILEQAGYLLIMVCHLNRFIHLQLTVLQYLPLSILIPVYTVQLIMVQAG